MKMFLKRVAIFIIIFSIVLSINSSRTFALNENLYGDLDNNGVFNVIDLVVLKRTLIGNAPFEISLYSADMNMDNSISLVDLVRMKKYFAGTVNHPNDTNTVLTWTLLNEDAGMPIISVVSFAMFTSCNVKTLCLPGRYMSEATAYISTVKNPNPELSPPKIRIASIKINDTEMEMSDMVVIVDPDWIFDSKVSNTKLEISNLSVFSSLFTVMLDGTIYPYRDIENTYSF